VIFLIQIEDKSFHYDMQSTQTTNTLFEAIAVWVGLDLLVRFVSRQNERKKEYFFTVLGSYNEKDFSTITFS
jgi:hypothetical protein